MQTLVDRMVRDLEGPNDLRRVAAEQGLRSSGVAAIKQLIRIKQEAEVEAQKGIPSFLAALWLCASIILVCLTLVVAAMIGIPDRFQMLIAIPVIAAVSFQIWLRMLPA